MDLQGKRIAILAEDDYQELELWYPLLRFKEAGAAVQVVGPGRSDVHRSKLGYPVKVDLPADQARAEDFDAIVVPGGYAPDRMRTSEAMVGLVREADRQGKVVAAICHAGWVLISAGILRGRRATCVANIKDDLVNAGATYVDEEVVVDGNLITSRTPPDLPAFCRAIIDALSRR
ncbi:MAG: type 1 glutamine amidotransferase [Firmicutes bacterium]|nr:type 1 glutamine amidotransferase [Bacillota bacterium]